MLNVLIATSVKYFDARRLVMLHIYYWLLFLIIKNKLIVIVLIWQLCFIFVRVIKKPKDHDIDTLSKICNSVDIRVSVGFATGVDEKTTEHIVCLAK